MLWYLLSQFSAKTVFVAVNIGTTALEIKIDGKLSFVIGIGAKFHVSTGVCLVNLRQQGQPVTHL
jgi:hypothetical protein